MVGWQTAKPIDIKARVRTTRTSLGTHSLSLLLQNRISLHKMPGNPFVTMVQRDELCACPWSGLLIHPGGDNDIHSSGFPVMAGEIVFAFGSWRDTLVTYL